MHKKACTDPLSPMKSVMITLYKGLDKRLVWLCVNNQSPAAGVLVSQTMVSLAQWAIMLASSNLPTQSIDKAPDVSCLSWPSSNTQWRGVSSHRRNTAHKTLVYTSVLFNCRPNQDWPVFKTIFSFCLFSKVVVTFNHMGGLF